MKTLIAAIAIIAGISLAAAQKLDAPSSRDTDPKEPSIVYTLDSLTVSKGDVYLKITKRSTTPKARSLSGSSVALERISAYLDCNTGASTPPDSELKTFIQDTWKKGVKDIGFESGSCEKGRIYPIVLNDGQMFSDVLAEWAKKRNEIGGAPKPPKEAGK